VSQVVRADVSHLWLVPGGRRPYSAIVSEFGKQIGPRPFILLLILILPLYIEASHVF
jgi:hypothetical protein